MSLLDSAWKIVHGLTGNKCRLIRFSGVLFFFLLIGADVPFCLGEIQRVGVLKSVPAISARAEWDRFKILVWPYRTNILKDYALYRRVGFGGFQIDKGAAKQDEVAFSISNGFPYYVGHAAAKGYLYLTGENADIVKGKRGLVQRPLSLATPLVIDAMKGHLDKNVSVAGKGFVLAYAFDDEISLGRFVNPCDVDASPLSLDWFRRWLGEEYDTIRALNSQWGMDYKKFDKIMPAGFEDVRKIIQALPLSQWNLSPWVDFRSFMDFQFAAVLSELTRYTNLLDARVPAGFVGGQAPGPWGGYNYALLRRAVQWMEAYDIHGTNEILRSWWDEGRRPRMQTFFSTKNSKLDSWFLWYYMLHGNQAVIAWPEGWFHMDGENIAPHVLALEETFKSIQGPISAPIMDPATHFDPDPIGIYYSHSSIQVGWAMDAVCHGTTWINRFGSIDNENQSKGVLRNVWCKTLEDLGYQYDMISYLDVQENKINLTDRFRVIILPKTICLSDKEAAVFKRFVENGGTLIADYLCGIMDAHGKGRNAGALDALFCIRRDESVGYLNGKGFVEIDAEKFKKPFLNRFTHYSGTFRYRGIPVFERGSRPEKGAHGRIVYSGFGKKYSGSVIIERSYGRGRTVYLNLSPLEYWAPFMRFGAMGEAWREIVGTIIDKAGLRPRVVVKENGKRACMVETLFWKNGDKRYMGIVKNPTYRKALKVFGNKKIAGITHGGDVALTLTFRDDVALYDIRKRKLLGRKKTFQVNFLPWEGRLYEVKRTRAKSSSGCFSLKN